MYCQTIETTSYVSIGAIIHASRGCGTPAEPFPVSACCPLPLGLLGLPRLSLPSLLPPSCVRTVWGPRSPMHEAAESVRRAFGVTDSEEVEVEFRRVEEEISRRAGVWPSLSGPPVGGVRGGQQSRSVDLPASTSKRLFGAGSPCEGYPSTWKITKGRGTPARPQD